MHDIATLWFQQPLGRVPDDPRLLDTLKRIYADEAGNLARHALRRVAAALCRWPVRSAPMPVTPLQGRMLYLMSRSVNARRVAVATGRHGISLLYLAAAVRDGDDGRVLACGLDDSARKAARIRLLDAGLPEWVALEGTLDGAATDDQPLDVLVVDSAGPAAALALRRLAPRLRPRGLVLIPRRPGLKELLQEVERAGPALAGSRGNALWVYLYRP